MNINYTNPMDVAFVVAWFQAYSTLCFCAAHWNRVKIGQRIFALTVGLLMAWGSIIAAWVLTSFSPVALFQGLTKLFQLEPYVITWVHAVVGLWAMLFTVPQAAIAIWQITQAHRAKQKALHPDFGMLI